MSADIKGTAVVWSTGTFTFSAGITASSMLQSVGFGVESEVAELKTGTGQIAGMVFHGFHKKARITCIPTGASIAAAVSAKEGYLPAPGTAIAISDSTGASKIGQNWIVVSATENRTVDGVVTIDLELENAATDISTSAV